MEFSHRLELFGPEIFAALNDKKVALEAEGRHLYNLSVGTPDFAPADHLKQALIDAAQDNENWKYSLRDIPEMLNAVCGYYQRRFNVDTITPDKVMSFSGSQDGIGHLGLALCNDGDLVLLPDPCYPVFMTGSRLGGAEPWYYKLTKENHFLPDISAIPEDVARKAKFTPGAEECAVEFFSLSKSFNVTGARISFLVGRPDVIAACKKLRTQIDFGMFLPIQKVAVAALTGPLDGVQRQCGEYQRRRDALCGGLRSIGWDVPNSHGSMFVWAPVPAGYKTSMEFCLALIDKAGVICTPGSSFGPSGEGYVRFALTMPVEKIGEAVNAIKESGIL